MFDAAQEVNGHDPFTDITVLLPKGARASQRLTSTSLAPFDDAVIRFVIDLGRALREGPEARRFPELVALGFWARGATIKRLKTRFNALYPDTVRLARGLAFHIAPANVDTIFLYSLLISLLAGNTNVVRLSSRATEQSEFLLEKLSAVIAQAAPAVQAMVTIIQYGYDSRITDVLSERATLRITWGGDATVNLIRRSSLAPSGSELVFPNKYSLAVLDANVWLVSDNKAPLARAFVNDTLWFGQMACSSPRALVWRGTVAATETASASFWNEVDQAAAAAALEWQDAYAVSKLLAEQAIAISEGGTIRSTLTNRVRVIRGETLESLGASPAAGHGFFREYRVAHLGELGPMVRSDWQTVVAHGIPASDWRAFLTSTSSSGISRIVPIGSALNFDAIWDGVDLLTSMTRLVTLAV